MQDHKLRHLWEEEAPSDWNEVRWTPSPTPSTQAVLACCTEKQEAWYMYVIPITWAWCNGKNGRHHFTCCSTDYTLNHWTYMYRTVTPSWLDKCPGTFTLWGVLSPSVPTHNQSLSTIHPFYPNITHNKIMCQALPMYCKRWRTGRQSQIEVIEYTVSTKPADTNTHT